jgi:hypothetical protein
MTSWKQLEAFLKAEAAKIGPAINAIAKAFKPMIEAGLEEIATAALNSVMVQAPKVLAGEEKFSAAVSDVITSLGTSGKSVGTAIAMTAVQQAYNVISALANPTTAKPAP